ncbi:MAG: M1 family metallopeptidase [Bacteroidetes bacterium]|nr:M1 family metallopeptidase [Bacteroidota bacterium]
MSANSILGLTLVIVLTNLSTVCGQAWQQQVDYLIDVELDEKAKTLVGKAVVTYHNQGPVALDSLYFHLWANAYGDKTSPFGRQADRLGKMEFRFAKAGDMGRYTAIGFMVDGQTVPHAALDPAGEIVGLKLPDPVQGGGQVVVTATFSLKLPKVFSRLGHDGNYYCLTQWYPKAVKYDEKGWHRMPYLDMGEYFNDFGSYDVFITLPSEYVVAATGNLLTEDELHWLAQLKEGGNPPSRMGSKKTLHYHQDMVHDFAWFANPDFTVDFEDITLPSGKQVRAWVFYEKGISQWLDGVDYVSQAVAHYSRVVGPYPYDNVSAVGGPISAGEGMEYPTITIVNARSSMLERVIMHEVGHNWFQGMLASNERRWPYLDEGFNTYVENRFYEYSGISSYDKLNSIWLSHFNRQRLDMACSQHSNDYDNVNYGLSVYNKTAKHLSFLEAYLGKETMDSCLHRYFGRWKHKHPGPQDVKSTFESVSGKDLDWFFDGLLGPYTTYDYDVADKRAKTGQGEPAVLIKKSGALTAPFHVSFTDYDGLGVRGFWVEGCEGDTLLATGPGVEQVLINHRLAVLEDNVQRNTAFLDRGKPLKIKLYAPTEKPGERRVVLAPFVGLNTSDGFMPGLAILNPLLPQPKWEYQLAPMFGLKSEIINWLANLQRNWFWHTPGRRHALSASINSLAFSLITRDNPIQHSYAYQQQKRVQLHLRYEWQATQARHLKEWVWARAIYIYSKGQNDQLTYSYINRYLDMGYVLDNTKAVFNWQWTSTMRMGAEFTQLRTEITGSFPYMHKKDIRFRLFAGGFVFAPEQRQAYSLWMTNPSGRFDYLLDATMLDRRARNRMLWRQLAPSEGGLTTPLAGIGSNRYLLAANVGMALPKTPFRLYANVAYTPDPIRVNNQLANHTLMAEAGLELALAKDIFSIYVPLVYSKQLHELVTLNTLGILDRITFILRLESLNPVKLVKEGVSFNN